MGWNQYLLINLKVMFVMMKKTRLNHKVNINAKRKDISIGFKKRDFKDN